MTQNLLPYQLEIDPTQSKMTALGGLPLFLDLASCLGLLGSIRKRLSTEGDHAGWCVSDVVLSLMLVNLAGGDCVSDLERLGHDVGFTEIMDLAHLEGLSRQQRRATQRKLKKLGLRAFPSTSSVFRASVTVSATS